MIWVYTITFGLWYALGFVLLIFIHEIGHYATAKRLGLPVSGPVFIPFVGAFIAMKEAPKDALIEAKVGYGGPFFGTIGAILALIYYWITGFKLAGALAYTGFFLNLFNLIPVHPLDGGRVVSAISPYFWLGGIPVLGFVIYKTFNPILVIIIFYGIVQLYRLWKVPRTGYYEVPVATRFTFSLLYFGLLTVVGLGTWYTMSI